MYGEIIMNTPYFINIYIHGVFIIYVTNIEKNIWILGE